MDRRVILAVVLCILVAVAFHYYNYKQYQEYVREHPEYLEKLRQERLERQPAAPVTDASPQSPAEGPAIADATDLLDLLPVEASPPTDVQVEVRSPFYQIQIAAQGGRPTSWKLLRYQEILQESSLLENYKQKLANISPQSPDVIALRAFLDKKLEWTHRMRQKTEENPPEPGDDGVWPAQFAVEALPTLMEGTRPLDLKWMDRSIDDAIPYMPSTTFLDVSDGEKTLELRGRYGPLEVVKTYVFRPDKYDFDYSISVRNVSEQQVEFSNDPESPKALRLGWNHGVALDLFNDRWAPPVLFQISNKIVAEGKVYNYQRDRDSSVIDFGVLQSRYFTVCIMPEGTVTPKVVRRRAKYDRGDLDLVLDLRRLKPEESREEHFTVYVGPKDPTILRRFDRDVGDILFRGFFWSMAKPFGLLFLAVLRIIYSVIPNWGLAIIVLTILTKVAMYPLMRKQMQSMKNMQRIQPKMKELEKYKDNQAKYQKELMALYKRENANPAGGCLPMLLTMPIFIGLYLVIYMAPELRGAPFMLWIQDLSRPDTLFSFYLPGFNWVVRFNVLPILNGIYTYYSQKKQIVDPKQAGMMQMMPLIFLFIFWNFPSGLVLYWVIQAVLTTVQQTIFNRLHEKEQNRTKASKSVSPLAARTARKTKKRG